MTNQIRRDKMRWKTRPGETKRDDKPDQTRQNEMRKPDQTKKKVKTKQTTTKNLDQTRQRQLCANPGNGVKTKSNR